MPGEQEIKTKVVSVDAMMRTFGAILLMISMSIAGWSLAEVVSLKERVAKVETKVESEHEILMDMKADIKEIMKLLLAQKAKEK